jgi:translation initiation factor IF-2
LSDKKIRIHELAKRFGLSGKDCAAKLRDFGFSKARSHMTALDDFEAVQAEGLLEANGVQPVSAGMDPSAGVGGLKVKKKLKKKAVEVPATPEPEPEPSLQEPSPAQPVGGDAGIELTPVGEETATSAPVESTATPDQTPDQATEPQPDAASAETGTAESEPAEAGVPEASVPEASVPEAGVSEAGVSEAGVKPPAPDAEADPIIPHQATPAAEVAPPADTPVPAAEAAPADTSTANGTAAKPTTTETPVAAGKTQGTPVAGDAAPAQPAEAKPAPAAKKPPGPKGKVMGFIDPSKLQQAQPRRRAESRRLQSRDDVTPDVRPSFAGRGGRGAVGGAAAAAGPRGKLTAAQLREREQGRFLRRQGRRRGGSGGRGRGRGGGGRGHSLVTESPFHGETVVIEAPITMLKLAEAFKLKAGVLIKQAMFSQLGMFNQNTLLDDDTAGLIAAEFEIELEIKHEVTAEAAHLESIKTKRSEVEEGELVDRAPTVAFLGHVDHGKTTLIDKIRETKVADGESGGITQHIGAYRVKTVKGHSITIVDTPGHQAFTAMRARGARAVDIVVLVVAGDDGVKPSTAEAINHARAAGTPIVVALNKKDKPGFNAAQATQQLMGHELVPEAYGGQTAFFETSGITGEGIEELLEHIFLMGDAELELKAHPKGPASGVVLEAQVEQGRGIVAHLLVQDGTLNTGDVILAGEGYGKVKSIHDDRSAMIKQAGPSIPVQVTGLAALPGVGDPFHVIDSLDKAKEIATERERNNRAMALAGSRGGQRELASILGSAPKKTVDVINLIVRADVQGSAEVIRHEVDKLKHEEVEVKLVNIGVGPITESDVNLGATSNALLVAFHVGINGKARKEAERFGLDIRRYEVIYELLDDLRDAMEGALAPDLEEIVAGHVEIRKLFKSSKIGLIAGCYVLDGAVRRNSKVRLLRDDKVIYNGEIGSLRRESEDAKEVREGFECGITLRDYRDLREGDIIEVFSMKEIKRALGELKS